MPVLSIVKFFIYFIFPSIFPLNGWLWFPIGSNVLDKPHTFFFSEYPLKSKSFLIFIVFPLYVFPLFTLSENSYISSTESIYIIFSSFLSISTSTTFFSGSSIQFNSVALPTVAFFSPAPFIAQNFLSLLTKFCTVTFPNSSTTIVPSDGLSPLKFNSPTSFSFVCIVSPSESIPYSYDTGYVVLLPVTFFDP